MAEDHPSGASAEKGLGPVGGAVLADGGRLPRPSDSGNPSGSTPIIEGTAGALDAPLNFSAPTLADRTSCDGGFGTLLEPVLHRACGGRLGPVNWFRTDWQRGGALTGYAPFTEADGRETPVVVKLPVPPCERFFLQHLHAARTAGTGEVAPRLLAHGESLGGYDFAWVVMERLHHGPLGPRWDGREFELLVDAAARFYAATNDLPPTGEPIREPWESLLVRGRDQAHAQAIPHAQQWNRALKAAGRKLAGWLRLWHDRPITGWCHGDLHLGNAMTRHAPPQGPALLFDFAKVRIGHWVQDAIYCEHLFWSRPHHLAGRRLARDIAHARKRLNLPVDREWARLAEVYRYLLALSAPALLHHEGDATHLRACLAVLDQSVL